MTLDSRVAARDIIIIIIIIIINIIIVIISPPGKAGKSKRCSDGRR